MAINKKTNVYNITYIAMCIALISICAWITVPFFIGFTLQSFAVFLIASISSLKKSFISVLGYIILGIIGIPVFSGFNSGLSVLLGNTGGYIYGFLISSVIIPLFILKFGRKVSVLACSMLISLTVCYILGTLWYMLLYIQTFENITFFSILSVCVFPFLVPDILKILLAITISNRIWRIVA